MIRILCIFISFLNLSFGDIFYYENAQEQEAQIKSELNLLGIFNNRAKINQNWIKVGGNFAFNNQTLRLLEIKRPCAIVQNISTKENTKICFKGANILQGK